ARAGRSDSALAMVQDRTQELFDQANAALGRLSDGASEGAKRQMALSTATFALTQRSVTVALAVCVLLGTLIALSLGRLVARPVREITAKMRRLALGDTDQTVVVRSSDEVGALAASFNEIVLSQTELAAMAPRMAEGD